jgi:hypothetical protein
LNAEAEAKEAEKKAEIEAKKVEAGPNMGELAAEAAVEEFDRQKEARILAE